MTTNIPAFPVAYGNGGRIEGMTLRDYFAAKAIQAMVSSMYPKDSNHYDNKWYAENAYRIADAMLKARG
jgi:hypoxanthine phosphoribosyltransferase